MKWENYFRLFLQLEENLISILDEVDFNGNERMYSPKLSLLLLRTCPLIESYMVEKATTSQTVFMHDLFQWEHKEKLWKVKNINGSLQYQIKDFPKFTYVMHEVFGIGRKSVVFYKYHRVKYVEHGTITLKPFESFASVQSFRNFTTEKPRIFPIGYNTPRWWTAYNKIKHDFSESINRVTYKTVVDAIGGFFLLLTSCDPNMQVVEDNKFLVDKNIIQSQQFELRVKGNTAKDN